ncbi:AAA family ATPase [filamentous cyanobacterium LEGE 11480]|uniref:AAA family ATPase n=1 Tax=Romeriopsis navalis LEGE 11480 TaxID=2777977 RepID=A0A928VSW9_9CYAN|nr:AAA family ATPase [Romeriopsis navalis]MBE9033128.1 AAA family ATPase [Romeriopsis navalis LEGE 11480]
MLNSVICHLLIAPPGAGKSTLAKAWTDYFPNTVWISTDRAREQFYGDANEQGEWHEIATILIQEITQAVTQGKSVIYDATNTKRAWRLGLLGKLQHLDAIWIGWQIEVSLETCLKQNQQRDRQVPKRVIQQHLQCLSMWPPCREEGFAAIHPVPQIDKAYDFEKIEYLIQLVPRQVKQRRNRYHNQVQHPYSSLLAFEQLIYLIAALMECPGLGNLQNEDPQVLQQQLNCPILPSFQSAIEEISYFIQQRYGFVYADIKAIAHNLDWLQENSIINAEYCSAPLNLELSVNPIAPEFSHRYSDHDAFTRLMLTIRFLAHHPIMVSGYQHKPLSARLADALRAEKVVGYSTASIRRDIQTVFKPYGIMSEHDLRQGYFVGTGILSREELLRVYQSLEGQAIQLSDPIALAAYETFEQRLKYLGLSSSNTYPIRTLVDQPIADPKYLSPSSLAQPEHAACLERAIRDGRIIRLYRIHGTGRFPQDSESLLPVLPLQIVFYNIGWYLGYQRLDNQLLQFERIDRLGAKFTDQIQEQHLQRQAYKNLLKLQQASYGVFLGTDAKQQQDFLSDQPERRNKVEATLEIWLDDVMFKFVSEGTMRFPNIRMSPRRASMSDEEKRLIFNLEPTQDAVFPHRLQAVMPRWSIESVDLRTWISSFAGQIKVIAPQNLACDIVTRAKAVVKIYKN